MLLKEAIELDCRQCSAMDSTVAPSGLVGAPIVQTGSNHGARRVTYGCRSRAVGAPLPGLISSQASNCPRSQSATPLNSGPPPINSQHSNTPSPSGRSALQLAPDDRTYGLARFIAYILFRTVSDYQLSRRAVISNFITMPPLCGGTKTVHRKLVLLYVIFSILIAFI